MEQVDYFTSTAQKAEDELAIRKDLCDNLET